MPDPADEHVGVRIARIRKQRFLTQQGLAMRANISTSLLSKVECGQRPASPSLVATCARALNVGASDLLGPSSIDELRRDQLDDLIQPIRDCDPPTGAQGAPVVPAERTSSFRGRRPDHQVGEQEDESQLLARRLEPILHRHGRSTRDRDAVLEQFVRGLAFWAGDDMKRRELLQVLGWAAANVAASGSPGILDPVDPDQQERIVRAVQSPSRVDDSVIDNVEDVLSRCMRQDDALGPQSALATTLAQRDLVSMLIQECPDRLRDRLLSVWSNLSRFAGWLSFDLADYRGAEYYYEDAREKAHEAQNTSLGVMVLANLSHLATWTHRPRRGIDHAMAAQGWARHTDPMLRAYAADVAARAYAADGQDVACLAELDTAADTLAHTETVATSLAYFYGPGQLESTRSTCMLSLGRHQDATAAARLSLAGIDTSFVRNRAIATLNLGRAHLVGGHNEEAAAAIMRAAELTVRNRSARVVAELRSTRAGMDRWATTTPVRELDDYLAAVGLA